MAQATQIALSGTPDGNNTQCKYCGGRLELIDGTEITHCDTLGGFSETYECASCGMTGKLKHRYADGKTTYTGACADYEN